MALWTQPAVSAYGADQALPLIDTIQNQPKRSRFSQFFDTVLLRGFQLCNCHLLPEII